MARDVESAVEKLLDDAQDLPYGPARVALMEEAVRYADTHGNIDLAYEARDQLIDTATSSGRCDLLLVHYPWLLAQFDRNPDRYDEFDLLWQYKWAIGNAVDFYQLSLEQLGGMFEEMKRRFRRFGEGKRELASFQMAFETRHGSPKEAKKHYKKFAETRRDILSDCDACEANTIVDYHLGQGDRAAAIHAAKKTLDGRLTCHAEPENTLAALVIPIFLEGEDRQAIQVHTKGVKLAIAGRSLSTIGEHIQFLALSNNHSEAVKLFERFLPDAIASYEPLTQFEYLLAGRLLCDCLLATQWKGGVRVPKELASEGRKRSAEVGILREWLDEKCGEIAKRFDARNGNDRFAQRVLGQEQLREQSRTIALRKR